jgi:hypothetical protein
MNKGPRGDCLMKKTEGRKSRDTVPLSSTMDQFGLLFFGNFIQTKKENFIDHNYWKSLVDADARKKEVENFKKKLTVSIGNLNFNMTV